MDVDKLISFLNEELDVIPEEPEEQVEEQEVRGYQLFVKDTTALCWNLHTDTSKHVSIMDSGADTCVIGQGWEVISEHPT